MIKKIVCVLNIIVTLFMLMGCVFTHTRINPELALANSVESAKMASDLYAATKGGMSHHIIGHGSMIPTIQTGDYVVTAPIDVKKNNMLGKIIVYKTEGSLIKVCHRVVGKDLLGYIVQGDNNNQYDANIRITNENCVGEVIAIFRPSLK